MVGHKSQLDKRVYSYWITESNRNKPLDDMLIIHGYGGAYSGLEGLSSRLSEDNNILGLDLPGYGSSEPMKKKHSLKNYANFLDHFCNETRFHKITVIGHSLGADIGMVFAANYPERVKRLILIGPVINISPVLASFGKFYYNLASKVPPRIRHKMLHNHALTLMSDHSMFKNASETQKAKILRDDYINDHLMSDKPTIENYISLLNTDFLKLSSQITPPTLILAGSEDPLSPKGDMEKLARQIPNSELKIFKGEGHFLPLESTHKVVAAIRNFT